MITCIFMLVNIQQMRNWCSISAAIMFIFAGDSVQSQRLRCFLNAEYATENLRLRKKLEEAEKENLFLKKAAAFFAKEID